MADASPPAVDNGPAAAAAAAEDSRPQGVRARPLHRLTYAIPPSVTSSRARPTSHWPCSARSAVGLAGAAAAAALRARAESMLLGAGKRPIASGMEPAASQATNGLIIELRRAAAELWEARAEAIKASCAPHASHMIRMLRLCVVSLMRGESGAVRTRRGRPPRSASPSSIGQLTRFAKTIEGASLAGLVTA